jgi:hypothetical protein
MGEDNHEKNTVFCITWIFIIDLNNGNVYDGIQSTHGIKYNVNSSLIVINDPDVVLREWKNTKEIIPNWIFIDYVIIENNNFKLLLRINPYNDFTNNN